VVLAEAVNEIVVLVDQAEHVGPVEGEQPILSEIVDVEALLVDEDQVLGGIVGEN